MLNAVAGQLRRRAMDKKAQEDEGRCIVSFTLVNESERR
jgi:hypothetical protein